MKIYTLPKVEVERRYNETRNNKDKVLISILSSCDTRLSEELRDSYRECLELRFDDLPFNITKEERTNLNSDFYGMRSFGEKEYWLIKTFIEDKLESFKYWRGEDFYIHCSAGVSRSGAVAIGISMLLNDKELYEQILRDNKILPNQLVLSYFIKNNINKSEFDLCSMYRDIIKKRGW